MPAIIPVPTMPNPSSDDVMSLFSLVERMNSIEKQEPKKGGIQQGLNGGRHRRGGRLASNHRNYAGSIVYAPNMRASTKAGREIAGPHFFV
jgi:hypothetical protein